MTELSFNNNEWHIKSRDYKHISFYVNIIVNKNKFMEKYISIKLFIRSIKYTILLNFFILQLFLV